MDGEVKDSDDNLVTPKNLKLKRSLRTKSTRETQSTDSLFSSNSNEKIPPRYLRPSTGSCHDFCKYGRKDISEVVAKHPFLRRSMSNKIDTTKEQTLLGSLNLGERINKLPFLSRSLSSKVIHDRDQTQLGNLNLGEKRKKHPLLFRSLSSKTVQDKDQKLRSVNLGERKKDQAKPRASPQLKSEFFEKSEVYNSKWLREKQVNIKLGAPLHFGEAIESTKQTVRRCLENEENQVENRKLGCTEKGEVINLKTTLHSNVFSGKSEIGELQSMSPAKETEVLGGPNIIEKDVISLPKKSAASIEHNMVTHKASSLVKKPIRSAQFQTHKKKDSSPLKRVDLSSKAVITLKRRKTTAMKPIFLLSPSASTISPKIPLDGILSVATRKYGKEKHASYSKNQEKHKKTEHDSKDTKEKTVCANDPKTVNSQLDFKRIEEKAMKPISEKLATERKIKTPKGEEKRRNIRIATVLPVEYPPKSHKLRLGRGKVVDLRPEIDSPRRLRFKKAKLVGNNKNGYGKVGVVRVKKAAEPDAKFSSDCSLEDQAVSLRHQDMQMKKDSQGLLNYVIEETATILGETRKSKVKALVGAFETVISLQESKPASTV